MSVLIEDMKMPDKCINCPFMVSRDNDDCILQSEAANGRFETWDDMKAECPLAETQPESKWIPCSDKIPSEAQECWITAKDGTVYQGMFTRQYGERRDSGFICNGFGFAWLNAVAAWMPYEMPEPYQEEGE